LANVACCFGSCPNSSFSCNGSSQQQQL